ncbi:MAG: putative peptidoglycan glycosyltransferase FtsW [Pseudomonadota bacterium]
MHSVLSRTDDSILGQWWWTVDRTVLGAIALLMGIGLMLSFAASPSIAQHLNLPSFYFAFRHAAYLLPLTLILISVSLLSVQNVKRLAVLIFLLSLALTFTTLFTGVEVKGARRWLSLGGMSLQPSEYLKPSLVVLSAWMFSEAHMSPQVPGRLIAFSLLLICATALVLQPDFGMLVLIIVVWFAQFFLAGMPLLWIAGMLLMGGSGLFMSYLLLPHVARRIDLYLSPNPADRFSGQYQITQSLEAFMHGGLLGQGPGEGVIKRNLPDAHADFVFAVAGEEFGMILCVLIAGLFMFIVLRSMMRAMLQNDLFSLLAVSGLVTGFGLQAMINIASTLGLIPTKGMTLPFLSYGGSSMLALALTMGMVLALTRRRV